MSDGSVVIRLELDRDEFDRQLAALQRERLRPLRPALRLDTSYVQQQLQQLKLPALSVQLQADQRSIASLSRALQQTTAGRSVKIDITPTVDHKPLVELNQHLDKKIRHGKAVNQYFANNPIRPLVDNRSLAHLNRQLDAVQQSMSAIIAQQGQALRKAADLGKIVAASKIDNVKTIRVENIYRGQLYSDAIDRGLMAFAKRLDDVLSQQRRANNRSGVFALGKGILDIALAPVKGVAGIATGVLSSITQALTTGLAVAIGEELKSGLTLGTKEGLQLLGLQIDKYTREKFRKAAPAVAGFFGYESLAALQKDLNALGKYFDSWIDPQGFSHNIDQVELRLAKFVDNVRQGKLFEALGGAIETHITEPIAKDIERLMNVGKILTDPSSKTVKRLIARLNAAAPQLYERVPDHDKIRAFNEEIRSAKLAKGAIQIAPYVAFYRAISSGKLTSTPEQRRASEFATFFDQLKNPAFRKQLLQDPVVRRVTRGKDDQASFEELAEQVFVASRYQKSLGIGVDDVKEIAEYAEALKESIANVQKEYIDELSARTKQIEAIVSDVTGSTPDDVLASLRKVRESQGKTVSDAEQKLIQSLTQEEIQRARYMAAANRAQLAALTPELIESNRVAAISNVRKDKKMDEARRAEEIERINRRAQAELEAVEFYRGRQNPIEQLALGDADRLFVRNQLGSASAVGAIKNMPGLKALVERYQALAMQIAFEEPMGDDAVLSAHLPKRLLRLVRAVGNIGGALTSLPKRVQTVASGREVAALAEQMESSIPKGQEGIIFTVGGREFKGGEGSYALARYAKASFPRAYTIAVPNAETDFPANPELRQKRREQDPILQILTRVLPQLEGGMNMGNTLANITTLLSNATFAPRNKDAEQLAAKMLAAIRAGYSQEQVAAMSYSLGGMTVQNALAILKTLGIDKTKGLSIAYPYLGLQTRDLQNYKAGILAPDPLSFPLTSGLVGQPPNAVVMQARSSLPTADQHSPQHWIESPDSPELLQWLSPLYKPVNVPETVTDPAFHGHVVQTLYRGYYGTKLSDALRQFLQGKDLVDIDEQGVKSLLTSFAKDVGNDILLRLPKPDQMFTELADFVKKTPKELDISTPEGNELLRAIAGSENPQEYQQILSAMDTVAKIRQQFEAYGEYLYGTGVTGVTEPGLYPEEYKQEAAELIAAVRDADARLQNTLSQAPLDPEALRQLMPDVEAMANRIETALSEDFTRNLIETKSELKEYLNYLRAIHAELEKIQGIDLTQQTIEIATQRVAPPKEAKFPTFNFSLPEEWQAPPAAQAMMVFPVAKVGDEAKKLQAIQKSMLTGQPHPDNWLYHPDDPARTRRHLDFDLPRAIDYFETRVVRPEFFQGRDDLYKQAQNLIAFYRMLEREIRAKLDNPDYQFSEEFRRTKLSVPEFPYPIQYPGESNIVTVIGELNKAERVFDQALANALNPELLVAQLDVLTSAFAEAARAVEEAAAAAESSAPMQQDDPPIAMQQLVEQLRQDVGNLGIKARPPETTVSKFTTGDTLLPATAMDATPTGTAPIETAPTETTTLLSTLVRLVGEITPAIERLITVVKGDNNGGGGGSAPMRATPPPTSGDPSGVLQAAMGSAAVGFRDGAIKGLELATPKLSAIAQTVGQEAVEGIATLAGTITERTAAGRAALLQGTGALLGEGLNVAGNLGGATLLAGASALKGGTTLLLNAAQGAVQGASQVAAGAVSWRAARLRGTDPQALPGTGARGIASDLRTIAAADTVQAIKGVASALKAISGGISQWVQGSRRRRSADLWDDEPNTIDVDYEVVADEIDSLVDTIRNGGIDVSTELQHLAETLGRDNTVALEDVSTAMEALRAIAGELSQLSTQLSQSGIGLRVSQLQAVPLSPEASLSPEELQGLSELAIAVNLLNAKIVESQRQLTVLKPLAGGGEGQQWVATIESLLSDLRQLRAGTIDVLQQSWPAMQRAMQQLGRGQIDTAPEQRALRGVAEQVTPTGLPQKQAAAALAGTTEQLLLPEGQPPRPTPQETTPPPATDSPAPPQPTPVEGGLAGIESKLDSILSLLERANTLLSQIATGRRGGSPPIPDPWQDDNIARVPVAYTDSSGRKGIRQLALPPLRRDRGGGDRSGGLTLYQPPPVLEAIGQGLQQGIASSAITQAAQTASQSLATGMASVISSGVSVGGRAIGGLTQAAGATVEGTFAVLTGAISGVGDAISDAIEQRAESLSQTTSQDVGSRLEQIKQIAANDARQTVEIVAGAAKSLLGAVGTIGEKLKPPPGQKLLSSGTPLQGEEIIAATLRAELEEMAQELALAKERLRIELTKLLRNVLTGQIPHDDLASVIDNALVSGGNKLSKSVRNRLRAAPLNEPAVGQLAGVLSADDIIQRLQRRSAELQLQATDLPATQLPDRTALLSRVGEQKQELGRLRSRAFEIIKELSPAIREMVDVGSETALGFKAGFEAKFREVPPSASRNLRALISEIKKVLGIASPSRVMAEIGRMLVAGLEQGIDLQQIRQLGQRLAAALLSATSGLRSEYDVMPPAEQIRGQVDATDIFAGLDTGSLRQLALQQASDYVAAWKQALGIASPSRVFEEIGEDIRAGLEEGVSSEEVGAAIGEDIAKGAESQEFRWSRFTEKLREMGWGGQLLADALVTARNALIGLFTGYALFENAQRLTEWLRDSYRVAIDFERINTGIAFAFGSDALKARRFLAEESRRMGTSLLTGSESYLALAATTRNTSMEGAPTEELYKAVSEASAVLGLDAQRTQLVFTALTQIASKGRVSAEEIRQQLGEQLPGAMQIAARAMGVTETKFNEMLQRGEILSSTFIPRFARQLRVEMAGSLHLVSNSAQDTINRYQNAQLQLQRGVSNAITPVTNTAIKALTAGLEVVNSNLALAGSLAGGVMLTGFSWMWNLAKDILPDIVDQIWSMTRKLIVTRDMFVSIGKSALKVAGWIALFGSAVSAGKVLSTMGGDELTGQLRSGIQWMEQNRSKPLPETTKTPLVGAILDAVAEAIPSRFSLLKTTTETVADAFERLSVTLRGFEAEFRGRVIGARDALMASAGALLQLDVTTAIREFRGVTASLAGNADSRFGEDGLTAWVARTPLGFAVPAAAIVAPIVDIIAGRAPTIQQEANRATEIALADWNDKIETETNALLETIALKRAGVVRPREEDVRAAQALLDSGTGTSAQRDEAIRTLRTANLLDPDEINKRGAALMALAEAQERLAAAAESEGDIDRARMYKADAENLRKIATAANAATVAISAFSDKLKELDFELMALDTQQLQRQLAVITALDEGKLNEFEYNEGLVRSQEILLESKIAAQQKHLKELRDFMATDEYKTMQDQQAKDELQERAARIEQSILQDQIRLQELKNERIQQEIQLLEKLFGYRRNQIALEAAVSRLAVERQRASGKLSGEEYIIQNAATESKRIADEIAAARIMLAEYKKQLAKTQNPVLTGEIKDKITRTQTELASLELEQLNTQIERSIQLIEFRTEQRRREIDLLRDQLEINEKIKGALQEMLATSRDVMESRRQFTLSGLRAIIDANNAGNPDAQLPEDEQRYRNRLAQQAIAAANARALGLINPRATDYAVNGLRIYDLQRAMFREEQKLWGEKLQFLQTEQRLQRELLQLQLERSRIELEQQRIDLERSRDEALARGDQEGVQYAEQKLGLLDRMRAVTEAITAVQLAAQKQRAEVEQRQLQRQQLDNYGNLVAEAARNPFLQRGSLEALLREFRLEPPLPSPRDRDRMGDRIPIGTLPIPAQDNGSIPITPQAQDDLLAALRRLSETPAPTTRRPDTPQQQTVKAGDIIITVNNTFAQGRPDVPQIERQIVDILERVANRVRHGV